MKKAFLSCLQFVAFKLYFILNKIGLFKVDYFENLFIKSYYFYKSRIESESLDFLNGYISKHVTVIDVGANIGFFTLQISKFLDSSSTIIAIEPSGVNLSRMRKVIQSKKPEPNIIVVSAALSEAVGWGRLEIDASNPANHKVTKVTNFKKSVELQTLDSVTREVCNVALIKIDVQGHELAVLKGGRKLLSKQSPALLIEIDNRNNSTLGGKIWQFLDTKGYFMFTTTDLQKPISRGQLEGLKGYFDIFCIKKETVNVF